MIFLGITFWMMCGVLTAAIRVDVFSAGAREQLATFLGGPLSLVFYFLRWAIRAGYEPIRDEIRDRRKRRAQQLERDYEDVLKLIEWKPKELTEVQRLQEELSI